MEAEALVECGLELHAAEAVEVEVFGEAELVGVGGEGGCSPGDGGDEPSRGVAVWSVPVMRGVGGEGGAGPIGYGAAEELAGGGVGELQVGPAEDAADLLEVGEGAVGAVRWRSGAGRR